MSDFNNKVLQQHAQMILDSINDQRITDQMIEDNEVHNEVFNTDYFIIGYFQANEWINENFSDTFTAIEIVRNYEVENFGEMYTDINSEKIANMLSYIAGQAVIDELDFFDSLEELKESLIKYIEE